MLGCRPTNKLVTINQITCFFLHKSCMYLFLFAIPQKYIYSILLQSCMHHNLEYWSDKSGRLSLWAKPRSPCSHYNIISFRQIPEFLSENFMDPLWWVNVFTGLFSSCKIYLGHVFLTFGFAVWWCTRITLQRKHKMMYNLTCKINGTISLNTFNC